jgi:hypothetical protein
VLCGSTKCKDLNNHMKFNVLLTMHHNTVEPLLSGLTTGCHWPDNLKSWIIEDDPKMTC